MRIPLDRQSAVPLYRQIETHLREGILNGRLTAETRLPATRELAAELGVSRITVKNAYDLLASDGLISAREGSGTYVLPMARNTHKASTLSNMDWPLWQQQFVGEAEQVEVVHPQRRYDEQRTDLIRFTGVGDPSLFRIQEFLRVMQAVIRRDGIAAFEYGSFDGGYAPLRETITHILASQGIQADPEQVLVTSGSQQALTLTCQTLLKPGDVIVVEKPTYNLALELFRSLGLTIVGVPLDDHGLRIELLEPLLQQHHPRLIYTIPNFQNPSGACLSGERRRQLLMLADRYNVPIVEDDFVGDLRYAGRAQPAIKALDPGGRVIYVGTFSKMLMPGVRVGYLVADGPVLRRLVQHKRVSDLTTSTLLQRTLEMYVTVGRYQQHLRRSCRIYRHRRDVMLTAIKRYLPASVHVTAPQGGLFIWVRLPESVSSRRLLPIAVEEGVEFAPGSWFFPQPHEGDPFLRLNFVTQALPAIAEGIRRLGVALQRQTAS